MNEPQAIPPRRRLQELLAIPERQRTDEQWDEINELEISLTSANRETAAAPEQGNRQNTAAPTNQPRPNNGARDKKPFKRTHKRPPKASGP
ncbi:MAG: hypothetical protein A2Z01_06150 [Betaproteobacteria bacterium RBG_16_58_11]|nr:MAG: hypothetical protein A2Z01_06150 [Betaproteobacteria bacterium RBG_16_58_11]